MSSSRDRLLTLAGVGGLAYLAYQYFLLQGTATGATAGGALQSIGENLMNTLGVSHWMTTGEGPTYVPYLNQAEEQYGIPQNLLARIAYQESHFRSDIISGATRSPAGAVGIMQLMPQYFSGAGQDPLADIQTAAQLLSALYKEFGDWQVAVAAYNDGAGNIQAWLNGTKTLPQETQNYVAQVIGDVPVQGSIIQA